MSGPAWTGTPFGIQIVGPRRADRFVLALGLALERLFATDATLSRPVPDLGALRARSVAAGGLDPAP